MYMKTPATNLKGSIAIERVYDIRVDAKLGKATDMPPVNCACCDREIYKVTKLLTGEILGAECAMLFAREGWRAEASMNVLRHGRTLTKAQVAYAIRKGLLAC